MLYELVQGKMAAPRLAVQMFRIFQYVSRFGVLARFPVQWRFCFPVSGKSSGLAATFGVRVVVARGVAEEQSHHDGGVADGADGMPRGDAWRPCGKSVIRCAAFVNAVGV